MVFGIVWIVFLIFNSIMFQYISIVTFTSYLVHISYHYFGIMMELEMQILGIYTAEMWRQMSHIECWISKDNEILTRFTWKEFNLCGRTLTKFVYVSYFPIHLDVLAYMGHPYLHTIYHNKNVSLHHSSLYGYQSRL